MISRFKAQVADYAASEFMRKSVLSIRDGAGVFESILAGGRFRSALEIGTYRGVSSALMSRFCERVTTIDLVEGKMERDRQVFDRVRFWEAMGIGNIDLRLVSCEEEKADVIRSLEFDFAFVDGDHEGDAPRRDFDLVKGCGTVLLHDNCGDNGVVQLVRSLPRHEVTPMDIFALWTRS